MIEHKWTPDKESPFDGFVKVKIGDMETRSEHLEKIQDQVESEKLSEDKANRRRVRLVEKLAMDSILEVKLKIKKGEEIKDVKALSLYVEGREVIQKIGALCLEGIRLGKN